jgi:hypothetical protein
VMKEPVVIVPTGLFCHIFSLKCLKTLH